MKRWMPDYANAGTTDLLNGNGTQIIITDTGFICFKLNQYGSGHQARVEINEKTILATNTTTTDVDSLSGILPVAAGDIVTPTYASDTPNYMYFVPGRWV